MSQESEHSLARSSDQGLARQDWVLTWRFDGEESASKLMQNDGKVNFLTVISLRDPTSHPLVKICSPVLEATHSDPKDDHLHWQFQIW